MDAAGCSKEDLQVAMEISLSAAEAASADEEALTSALGHGTGMQDAELAFESLFATVVESAPPEAQRLAVGVPDRATKFELAEVVVKRAFSECPNLSLVVNGLLSRPLLVSQVFAVALLIIFDRRSELHTVCKLVPGVPVHPMLAKPTKKITEVRM